MEEITREQMHYILGIDRMTPAYAKVQEDIEKMHDKGFLYIDIAREMYLEMKEDYNESVRGVQASRS